MTHMYQSICRILFELRTNWLKTKILLLTAM